MRASGVIVTVVAKLGVGGASLIGDCAVGEGGVWFLFGILDGFIAFAPIPGFWSLSAGTGILGSGAWILGSMC